MPKTVDVFIEHF